MIRQLKETIPIERAKMRLRFVLPKKDVSMNQKHKRATGVTRRCSHVLLPQAKRIKDIIAPKMTLETEEWQDQELELVLASDKKLSRVLEIFSSFLFFRMAFLLHRSFNPKTDLLDRSRHVQGTGGDGAGREQGEGADGDSDGQDGGRCSR